MELFYAFEKTWLCVVSPAFMDVEDVGNASECLEGARIRGFCRIGHSFWNGKIETSAFWCLHRRVWKCDYIGHVVSRWMILGYFLKISSLFSCSAFMLPFFKSSPEGMLREMGQEGETEKHLLCAPARGWTYSLGMFPDWESNLWPFGSQADAPTNWAITGQDLPFPSPPAEKVLFKPNFC